MKIRKLSNRDIARLTALELKAVFEEKNKNPDLEFKIELGAAKWSNSRYANITIVNKRTKEEEELTIRVSDHKRPNYQQAGAIDYSAWEYDFELLVDEKQPIYNYEFKYVSGGWCEYGLTKKVENYSNCWNDAFFNLRNNLFEKMDWLTEEV